MEGTGRSTSADRSFPLISEEVKEWRFSGSATLPAQQPPPIWLWSKPWGPSNGPGPRGIPSLEYKHMVALRMGGTSAGSQECGGKQPKQVFWHRIFQKKKPKRQCKSRKVRVVLLSCQSPAPLWTCPSVKCGYANSIKPSPFQPLGPLGHSKSANLKVWRKKKKSMKNTWISLALVNHLHSTHCAWLKSPLIY